MKLYKNLSHILIAVWSVLGLSLSQSIKPINTKGWNEFVAPNFAAGDVRGPCPGLNALANHGYIPHNGVTSLLEVVSAANEVYGMAFDLGTALAAMGTVWVGNPFSLDPGFSIGGPTESSKNLLDNAFGLTGTPQGLIGSHNWIEADSSNTRNDLYLTGDAATLDLDKFLMWYNMSSDTVGDYDMTLLASRANTRFQESKAENPYFYYGPFTGMVARNAGYIFAGRLFANYSQGNAAGVLTKGIIRSFYAIYGDEGVFDYRKGWERIPENWYRVPSDYGLIQLDLDIVDFVSKYPELGSIGGNTGTTNSFTGIDIANLTGGIYNSETLLEGNNLICFVFQILKTLSPGALSTLYNIANDPLEIITNALNTPLLNLACPSLENMIVGGASWEEEVQNIFPGARQSRGGL